MNNRQMFLTIVHKALLGKKMRFAIAVSSIVLVAGLISALLSVSLGIKARFGSEFRRFGANVVLYPKGGERVMNESLTRKLSSGELGRYLYGYVPFLNEQGVVNGKTMPVIGTDFRLARRVNPWWKVSGSYPDEGAGEVLLGIDVAERLGVRVGDRVRLNPNTGSVPASSVECKGCHSVLPENHNRRLEGRLAEVKSNCMSCHQAHSLGGGSSVEMRVSGILSTGGDEDGHILTDLSRAQSLFNKPGAVSQVHASVLTGGELSLEDISRVIESKLGDVQATPVSRIARAEDNLLGKVQLLLTLVTLIVLSTTGLTLASMMTASVMERGREIGLMKAIGATHRAIAILFLAEAASMGLTGGGIGLLLGFLMSQLIGESVFATAIPTPPVVFPLTILSVITLAVLSSVPSIKRAMSIDPATSLRGE
ncbi:MAG: FtsX-like permease family protein [Actinobacteria bacterium]|nr:FtsX-like permease family protein [Actinomycetota bacterium]